jgi:hypothetical protein
VAVLAMAATSCVQQDEPGLALTKLEANLVFGVKPADSAPTPAQVAAQQPTPPAFPDRDLSLGDDVPFVRSPPPDCPDTDDIAVEFPADANIPVTDPPTRPREGLYRWVVRAGRVTADATVELGPPGFEERVIRNVREVPKTQWSTNPVATFDREVFTYEEVRRLGLSKAQAPGEGSERFLVTTYLVDTDALTASNNTTSGVIQPPKAGHPERGIALVKTEVVDGSGNPVPETRQFNPDNGVLMLPLAVASAEEYRSVAVDSQSGRTIVHQARVGSPERIDACGKLMDGWAVTATQQSTQEDTDGGTSAAAYNYTYIVAPQHGGVLIYERIVNPVALLAIEYTLGQFAPDPLPASGLPG